MPGGSIALLWTSTDPSAQVAITDRTGSPVAFTVNGSAVSFPYTLTGNTKFVTVNDGGYTLSVKLNGVEIASDTDGTRDFDLYGGRGEVFKPAVDRPLPLQSATFASQRQVPLMQYNWIGACFRGNSSVSDGSGVGAGWPKRLERLHLMASIDGLDWHVVEAGLTGLPAGKTVRDPSLYYEAGSGYLWVVFTTSSFPDSNQFGIARWDCETLNAEGRPAFTYVATITDAANNGTGGNKAWAPQFINIPGDPLRITYATNNSPLYARYATIDLTSNPDSPTVGTWASYTGMGGIDHEIVKRGSTYHAYYAANGLYHYTASSFTGTFTNTGTYPIPNAAGTGPTVGIEAPSIVVTPDGVTRMYLDSFNEGQIVYIENSSPTLADNGWSAPKAITTSLPEPRHCGMLYDTRLANAGRKIAEAAKAKQGKDATYLTPDPRFKFDMSGQNTPAVGAARGLRFTPDRDFRCVEVRFEVVTPSTTNDTFEISIYDSALTKIATSGVVTPTDALETTAGSAGIRWRRLTSEVTLRKGNAYYVFFCYIAKNGTSAAALRTASLDAGQLLLSKQAGQVTSVYQGNAKWQPNAAAYYIDPTYYAFNPAPALIESPNASATDGNVAKLQTTNLGFLLIPIEY